MVLHYGQEIFEGLKAYRQPDGSIASFRPEANAARFRGSAARLAMAELPDELFLASLAELVERRPRVGAAGRRRGVALPAPVHDGHRGRAGGAAVRGVPVLPDRLARPARTSRAGVKPVDVWLSTDYTRAALGGTGTAKCGGNYAASLLPAGPGRRARLRPGGLPRRRGAALDRRDGLEQPVLRLRLRRRRSRWSRPRSPAASWPGSPATRCWCWPRSWAARSPSGGSRGQEWLEGAADGRITEVFGCGTAAVITPIGRVRHNERRGRDRRRPARPDHLQLRGCSPTSSGSVADTHSWMRTLVPA